MDSKIKYSDRLTLINPLNKNGEWVEGDIVYPDVLEIRYYRREQTKEFDGHKLVESKMYRRIDG